LNTLPGCQCDDLSDQDVLGIDHELLMTSGLEMGGRVADPVGPMRTTAPMPSVFFDARHSTSAVQSLPPE
jgi:hypothetical protein